MHLELDWKCKGINALGSAPTHSSHLNMTPHHIIIIKITLVWLSFIYFHNKKKESIKEKGREKRERFIS